MKIPHRLFIGLFGLVALMPGCASVTKQPAKVYPNAQADKGLVYFYREHTRLGGMISYNIKDNGKVVGAIANGTYFFVFADPGAHTYAAKTEFSFSKTVQIEAGKTYYIACGFEMGFKAGRPTLNVVDEADAKIALANAQYATK